jgi:biopolymer transport protein ExbD
MSRAEAKQPRARVFEAPEETVEVRKRLRSPVKVQPPLMPLIDVMFTMMLFFVLCSSVKQDEGLIASTLPDKGGREDVAEKVPTVDIPVEVRPYGNGAVYSLPSIRRPGTSEIIRFDDEYKYAQVNPSPEAVPAEGLYQALNAYREKNNLTGETATIVIVPYGDVRWQYVVNAYNQAVRAKFKKIGFAPK